MDERSAGGLARAAVVVVLLLLAVVLVVVLLLLLEMASVRSRQFWAGVAPRRRSSRSTIAAAARQNVGARF